MQRTTVITILIVISLLEVTGKSGENGNTYALLITGINKNAKDRQIKDKALIDLRTFLLNNSSIKSDRLSMLANSRTLVEKGFKVSTARNLKGEIDKFASIVKTKDRFIFYYTGQANIADHKLRLNLPGPDITHQHLFQLLNQIKASSMLIVLDCPNSGLAVKTLARRGRIIIAGCNAEQPYSTKFSEYFVPALSNSESDSDNDGRISLLEAFTYASKKLDDFYRQMDLLKTENPELEDNGDGQASGRPWKYKLQGSDGLAASKFFFSR